MLIFTSINCSLSQVEKQIVSPLEHFLPLAQLHNCIGHIAPPSLQLTYEIPHTHSRCLDFTSANCRKDFFSVSKHKNALIFLRETKIVLILKKLSSQLCQTWASLSKFLLAFYALKALLQLQLCNHRLSLYQIQI